MSTNGIQARRVARNFDKGGKQPSSLNIEIFNALVFESIIHKTCIFLTLFSEYMFRFKPETQSIFI